METLPSSGLSSSSATYPSWVMFEQYMEIKVQDSSFSLSDDEKTLAAARTSAGHQIQVSLRFAEPPALSRVFLRIPDGLKEEKSKVLAADGDSVLVQVRMKEKNQQYYTAEHFVYNAGDHAADPPRPPSLWLLPPYYKQTFFSDSGLVHRELSADTTGLLRCGEDEFVVADIKARWCSDGTQEAKVYLFRSGEWQRYYVDITEDMDVASLSWDTIVPVNERLLCWVDLSRGVLLLDVSLSTAEALRVLYVRLPTAPHDSSRLYRNVCTTARGGALKFINIFGRCCCGTAASCNCEHSRHAYIIHTWTMWIYNGDGITGWMKDRMVDATELWALDTYKGLPCDPLDRPIVSIDKPEVICFRLREAKCNSRTHWQIMVNMRSKTIHSVSRQEEEVGSCDYETRDKLIPSKVSYFFNTFTGQSQSRMGDEQRITRYGNSSISTHHKLIPTLQPSSVADLASVPALLEMFDALKEIPSYGLAGPDEVKAYRILNSNNGNLLRSLLRIPKDLRKDWLLMEIKASNAY